MKSRNGRAVGSAEKGGRSAISDGSGSGASDSRAGMRQVNGVEASVASGISDSADGKCDVVWYGRKSAISAATFRSLTLFRVWQ